MITLVIDASTYLGTVAVLRDGYLASDGSAAMRGRDSEALMPAVADCLSRAGIAARQLSRVVCGSGPGSFTSLRIAASIAKGVAASAHCPLFGLSSLALLAVGEGQPGSYLAVLDALRGEAYVGGYSVAAGGHVAMILGERLVRQTEVDNVAASIGAVAVGPAQTVARTPHARAARLLESMLVESGPVSLAEWEPRYGRKAEAQMRWEATHQKPLPVSGSTPR